MFNSRSSISISTFLSSLIGSIVRGRRSVRCGQTCEYRKARLILTHDPGEELFLGALHPAAALFREHIDIPELIAEHATYRRVLEEAGARVPTVRQILLDGTGADGKPADRTKLENLRRFAAGFLTFDTQNLSPETAGSRRSTDNPFSPRHRLGTWFVSFCDNRSSGCRKRRSTRVSRPNIPKTP